MSNQYGYGSGFYKILSADLKKVLPDVKSFSPTNLKYMRYFYELYPFVENRPQAVDDLNSIEISSQVVDDLSVIFRIPWGHNRTIIDKCKNNVDKALFYVRKTLENNWSRDVLLNFLNTDLFERQGKAVTNFVNTLPSTQSDLAQAITKDPYNFDFLTLREQYDEKELNETYIGNVHRYELIYKYYCKYGSRQALGFCCSKEHAREMAREFSSRGIPSVAVFSDASGEYTEKRNVAIQKLKNGEIRAIFSVDMFNEGVDITSVDMVMFLRPTESPIVFLQQLGRGLRKCRGKEFLTVLDFIGNYEKAGRVRFLLEGKSDMYREGCHLSDTLRFPDDCMVDFDLKLIDLFAEMDRKHLKLKDQVINEYFRVKDLLGKRPTRLDLFTYMDNNIYETAITHSKDNPFKRYLEFLNDLGELSQIEVEFYKGIGREFISLLENTNMSKVYKMPVLMAFYNNSDVLMEVSEKQLLSSWKEFFSTGTNWKDLDKNMTLQKYKDISDKDHLKKILAMPVHFLLESGKGFFVKNDDVTLGLREELRPLIDNPVMIRQMKDVIDYRTMDYYQRRYRERQNE